VFFNIPRLKYRQHMLQFHIQSVKLIVGFVASYALSPMSIDLKCIDVGLLVLNTTKSDCEN
jgi:hypothetical protein